MKLRLSMVLLILLVSCSPAYAKECAALKSKGFSERQVETTYRAFDLGRRDDLSYSLAAIVWKESSAGIHLHNPADPSAGAFQITLKNALHYVGWEDTEYNRGRMTQLLINDFNLAAEFAIINLKFWKAQFGENWMRIWRGYNGGYSNSKASQLYAKDIVKKIRVIGQCNWG